MGTRDERVGNCSGHHCHFRGMVPGEQRGSVWCPWMEASDVMRGRRRSSVFPVLVVVVLVGAMALVPVLANRRFYLSDDSAVQFLPTWRYVGELLRAGHFPLLDPSLWAGGNLAAEALFGLYNPLVLGNMVLVSALPDLLVAAVLVKVEFLVILGVGVYGLAREYDVPRPFAVVPAATVPFAGVTLYFDASSWFSALVGFAFVPHFWWTLRRSARGALTPLAPFAAGYLAITSGNPYGALGACLVVLSLTAEFALTRQWKSAKRTVLGGITVGLMLPLVYLPLVLTQSVSYRRGSLGNNGVMVPGLGDLLNASTPSFNAWIPAFEAPFLTVPATYLAWYAVPLLPWLRFDTLPRRLPAVSGLLFYAVIALMLCTGPSDVWMFRWPLRVAPYLVLPVAVLLAITLSQGLAPSQPRRRAGASALLILAGAYLAEATRPDLLHTHVVSTLLVGALVTTLVLAYRRMPQTATAPVAVLVVGCVAVLAFQVAAFPRNRNLTNDQFPTSVPATRAALAPRYHGTTLMIANNHAIQHSADPQRQFTYLMFGNMLQAIGVHAVNSYAGIGFQALTNVLCMDYNGSVCPGALAKVWQPAAPGFPPLADLLRLETIVVQNDLPGVAKVPIPAGWRVAEHNNIITVLHRRQPLPYRHGRLSHAPVGTVVTANRSTARTESLQLVGGPGGTLTFARLAWPGYTAYLNAIPIPVHQGPAGLLTVNISPRARGQLTIAWSPPGQVVGVLTAALGALLALAHSFTRAAAPDRHRRAGNTAAAGHHPHPKRLLPRRPTKAGTIWGSNRGF